MLISAVAYELVFEAVQLGKLTGFPTMGLFAGAFTFFFADRLIGGMGGSQREAIKTTHQSNLVVPLVLAIILDGVPESVVIGLGILTGGSVSLAMLVAVFISNLPEAVAATTGMRSALARGLGAIVTQRRLLGRGSETHAELPIDSDVSPTLSGDVD